MNRLKTIDEIFNEGVQVEIALPDGGLLSRVVRNAPEEDRLRTQRHAAAFGIYPNGCGQHSCDICFPTQFNAH